jgi:release factor glutamine methyltransferase
MLTIKAALEEARATIERIDAQVLLGHVLGRDRAWLAANPMHVLTEGQDARFDLAIARRAMGEPVAYFIGAREFYGRDFAVGPGVLIPRPETETLVEAVLKALGHSRDAQRIADLGTGSGAIAVTLACELPQVRIVATDFSADALGIAATNARTHGVADRIELVEGAWFEPLAGRRFELVVSNPPYVAAQDEHLEQGDLRFEPRGALTDGSVDGLDSIRAIVQGAAAHLEPGGLLAFEHGYDQADAARQLLAQAGFEARESIRDLAGIARVALGRKP